MANVKFYNVALQETYDALSTKEQNALYFIQDTQRLYHYDRLMGTGSLASAEAAGLLSAEDKAKLDSLVTGGISGLTPVDGTITIADAEDGGKSIAVAISAEAGNVLIKKDDGLYVDASGSIDVPEYAIEKQETAEDGFAVSYKLKKTVGKAVSYVGDVINVPKDLVLQSAILETVSEADVPYSGAVVGDPYIHMVFNDASASDIYVPVKGLVDTYTAGSGIAIENNIISVKIADSANGLVAVDGGGLAINLATADSAGAMSAADKAALDALVALGIVDNYATKEELQEVANKVAAVGEAYTWGIM